MRAEFYEPWDQIIHISKFVKHLTKEQEYLKTCDVEINDDAKVQFYVKQMIDSYMFDKQHIIEWENVSHKSFYHETYFFELLAEDEDVYTSVVGGTAKKACFESA